jgi:hypothetical protein
MEADYLSQSTAPWADRVPVRQRAVIFGIMALAAGAFLRVWMLHKFFEVNGDSQIYGGLAKNLLLHGQYATSVANGGLHSTLIRLPGYPLFLAACFRLFGMENYFAASCVQIMLDLAACVLLADFARRISKSRLRTTAALCTLWLAAVCPFTAIYAAEPLTESLTLFTLSLALWTSLRLMDRVTWGSALAFTFAVAYAALLRPDGALVGIALVPPVLFSWWRSRQQPGPRRVAATRQPLRIALVCTLLAMAPFAAWAWRNWRTFHVIQPLAPRYATDPGENTFPGWQRWVKTWCLDFVSTYDIYWNVPDNPLEIDKLPKRAFDSQTQYAETAKLAADYHAAGDDLTAEIDARFDRLAQERISAHPLRYYVVLPLGRMADMWLRPRIENLPIDLDWWVYKHHYAETRFSWGYAGLNAVYLILGIVGLCLRPRLWKGLLAYLVMRSALLCTIEAPEARYTLECFPILFCVGGIALSTMLRRTAVRNRSVGS